MSISTAWDRSLLTCPEGIGATMCAKKNNPRQRVIFGRTYTRHGRLYRVRGAGVLGKNSWESPQLWVRTRKNPFPHTNEVRPCVFIHLNKKVRVRLSKIQVTDPRSGPFQEPKTSVDPGGEGTRWVSPSQREAVTHHPFIRERASRGSRTNPWGSSSIFSHGSRQGRI